MVFPVYLGRFIRRCFKIGREMRRCQRRHDQGDAALLEDLLLYVLMQLRQQICRVNLILRSQLACIRLQIPHVRAEHISMLVQTVEDGVHACRHEPPEVGRHEAFGGNIELYTFNLRSGFLQCCDRGIYGMVGFLAQTALNPILEVGDGDLLPLNRSVFLGIVKLGTD